VYGLWVAVTLLVGCSYVAPGSDVDAGRSGNDGTSGGNTDARTDDAAIGDDAKVLVGCGAGYAGLTGGSPSTATYKGVNTNTPFAQARADCMADGADIVIIDNATEAAAVASLVQDTMGSPFFWVGLVDPPGAPDNDFVTIHGDPPPYLVWGSQQPSGGIQDCVLLDDSGAPHAFWDFQCDAIQVYVCECLQ